MTGFCFLTATVYLSVAQAETQKNYDQIKRAPETNPSPVGRIISQNRASYEPPCPNSTNNPDATYCEQVEATEAAENQVVASWWQVFIGAVSAGAVAGALVYTAKSTSASQASARAAQKSADAAERAILKTEEALDHARGISEIQLRAYVTIDSITMFPSGWGKFGEIVVKFKNSGQTPALITRFAHTVDIRPTNGTDFQSVFNMPKINPNDPWSSASIGSQGILLGNPQRLQRLDARQLFRMMKGELAIFYWGRIEYTDVFGQSRWTNWRAMVKHPLNLSAVAMSFCSEGNDSDWTNKSQNDGEKPA